MLLNSELTRAFFFEMAAMAFPCNGVMLCCVNIPTVSLMFFNKFAWRSIPYFNIFSATAATVAV